MKFDDWCTSVDEWVGNHFLRVMTGEVGCLDNGIEATAAIVPGHYASEEHIARCLHRLGTQASADLIHEKLPTTKGIRSGDLGEIYATEWINAHCGRYCAPIKRLRWKDHPKMAMRGEDAIGFLMDKRTKRLCFIKAEAKSRASLRSKALTDARTSLDSNQGLPSTHALIFISERLFELKNLQLADSIDDALLFSGNAPDSLLKDSLLAYSGPIEQWAVGLHVNNHAAFVAVTYERVINNVYKS